MLGAQSMKFGYQGGYLMDNRKAFSNSEYLSYRTQNGVPDQLTETIDRFPVLQRVRLRRVLCAGGVDDRPA